jgi:hypothetical protein
VLFVPTGEVEDGGESNGEYSSGAVWWVALGEAGGSQKLLVKDGVLGMSSVGGVWQGKQLLQSTGLSCVQSIDVGP